MSCLYMPLYVFTPLPCCRRTFFSRAARWYSDSRVSCNQRQSSHRRQISYSTFLPLEETETSSEKATGAIRIPWL